MSGKHRPDAHDDSGWTAVLGDDTAFFMKTSIECLAERYRSMDAY